ncbi:MAG: tetratricopeptide repeat protein [Planctomycetia bacterium]|jgi:tetratricopeptide (TPR) repeat protein
MHSFDGCRVVGALLSVPLAVALVCPALAAPAEESPGQADLDAAIETKLSADQLEDYATVIDLCRRALQKGLAADSRAFAEELYVGTLVDRAAMIVDALFEGRQPNDQWQRMRAFALRDLGEVLEKVPENGQALLMVARLESLPGGNRDRAAGAAAKAVDLLGDDKLQLARAHMVLGTVAEQENRMEHLDKAVELAPRDAEIRRARAHARLVADQFEGAREDLLVATAENPEDAAIFQALGLACTMADRLDEAEKAFDKALEIEPDSPAVLLQRARLLAVRGQRERSIADVDKAINLDPDDPQPRVLRARILHQAGETDQALTELERVLRAAPDNPSALEMRGLMAAERDDYQAAIRDFRRLVGRNGDDAVLVSQLGALYLAAKQPREAIRRFTRALEIDESHFPSRRGRSDAAISIGDHKAAIVDLEKALEQKPDDTGVLNNLAWLLATSPDDGLRDGKRAITLAEKACEKTEWKQPHIISTLAAGHAETGDFAAARKFSTQAVEGTEKETEIRGQLEKELASYEAGKPWRERQEMADATDGPPAAATAPAPEKRLPRRPFDEP